MLDVGMNDEAFMTPLVLGRRHHFLDQLADIDRLELELFPAFLDPGDIEDVSDQRR